MDIILGSSEVRLILSVGKENDWTGVTLERDGRAEFLGAEVLRIIAERLRNALTKPDMNLSDHEINGFKVRWILNLAEMHCSFYCALEDGKIRLFIKDSEGDLIHSFVLSPKEVDSWINNLSPLI
ncbi:MAG: hypothetical protein SFY67_03310 [Candidatus Melainabacteria bacterium]|nr:hypothetical protein [Candidatus Melainabacteria bacterium]